MGQIRASSPSTVRRPGPARYHPWPRRERDCAEQQLCEGLEQRLCRRCRTERRRQPRPPSPPSLSTAPPLEQIEKKLAFSRRIEQYMKILKAQGPPVRALNQLE